MPNSFAHKVGTSFYQGKIFIAEGVKRMKGKEGKTVQSNTDAAAGRTFNPRMLNSMTLYTFKHYVEPRM